MVSVVVLDGNTVVLEAVRVECGMAVGSDTDAVADGCAVEDGRTDGWIGTLKWNFCTFRGSSKP